jgi:hypothetical protein
MRFGMSTSVNVAGIQVARSPKTRRKNGLRCRSDWFGRSGSFNTAAANKRSVAARAGRRRIEASKR